MIKDDTCTVTPSILPGIPQNVIQRGNNRQVCFGSDEDFAAYAHWLEEYTSKFKVQIHAWVLMTNHVHLLLTPTSEDSVSLLMQALGWRYVRYFNYTYRRSGTLWEGRFKSCVVDADNYLLLCQRYIEPNPIRAGMVASPGAYRWSSYRANGYGKPAACWTPHPVYLALGKNTLGKGSGYRGLFRGQIDKDVLKDIRTSANQGMALGNERFKAGIEALSGRRVMHLKRGPKPKVSSF